MTRSSHLTQVLRQTLKVMIRGILSSLLSGNVSVRSAKTVTYVIFLCDLCELSTPVSSL